MVEWSQIGLILLGAGQSTRFGANKLAEPLLGIPLVRRSAAIFAEIPFARHVAVVRSDTPTVTDFGFEEILLVGALPQSASLRAGIEHLSGSGLSVMVALADMPLVTRSHIEALKLAFGERSSVCSMTQGIRKPPAIFAEDMLTDIVKQTGDAGARHLIGRLPTVESDCMTLFDIDNRDDMNHACDFLSKKYP